MNVGLSIVTGIALAAGVVVADSGVANPIYSTGELIGSALLARRRRR
ncbi:MAG: hypothetical protein WBO00_01420 [Steroidobacteraceae bacterium]